MSVYRFLRHGRFQLLPRGFRRWGLTKDWNGREFWYFSMGLVEFVSWGCPDKEVSHAD